MATDRYSDDHKIVVGNGSGTLTIDANLAISNISDISSNGDLTISSTEDVNILAESGVVNVNGIRFSPDTTNVGRELIETDGTIRWKAGTEQTDWYFQSDTRFNFYTDDLTTNYDLDINTDDFRVNSQDDIYLRGGQGAGTSCTLWLSPNGDSSPYIEMLKSTNEINIVTDSLNVTADSISISYSAPTTNTTIMPGSAFTILEKFAEFPGEGDDDTNAALGTDDAFRHTANGNVFWSMDTSTSGWIYGHIFAPLPESIPDGSIITHLGCALDRDGDSNWMTTYCYIRSYKFSNGADVELGASSVSDTTGHKTFFSDQLYNIAASEYQTMTIDRKNYAYTVKVKFWMQKEGDRNNIYLTAFKIGYTTTKYDSNI